jgi:hypothetical protein
MSETQLSPGRLAETAEEFGNYLAETSVSICSSMPSFESGADSPLGQPYQLGDQVIGNRFSILPMEGWDGRRTVDRPS